MDPIKKFAIYAAVCQQNGFEVDFETGEVREKKTRSQD